MKSASAIAQLAQRALLYEVTCAPKPGLVDPLDHTTHPDMDIFTFIDSSVALLPAFEAFVQAGFDFNGSDLTQLFSTIRPLGIQAEQVMKAATGNVNTHKGAIFSLGICLSATGYLQQQAKLDAVQLSRVIKAMLTGLVAKDFAKLDQKPKATLTNGEKLYLQYGLAGIRGEAEAGYPSIFKVGLPFLQHTSGTWNERLVNTLLKLISISEDSNLVKRSGQLATLRQVQASAQAILDQGGMQTATGRQLLAKLNQQANGGNYSLGGSADLLIVTIYLYLLFATNN